VAAPVVHARRWSATISTQRLLGVHQAEQLLPLAGTGSTHGIDLHSYLLCLQNGTLDRPKTDKRSLLIAARLPSRFNGELYSMQDREEALSGRASDSSH
jgi:hypothetical protein